MHVINQNQSLTKGFNLVKIVLCLHTTLLQTELPEYLQPFYKDLP